jgi:hypothetical protein
MSLARDHAALELTLRKRKARMGAGIFHCVDTFAYEVETNVDAFDADT